MTSEAFLTLTAALAFSRGQAICVVSHSNYEDPASEHLSRRFKVHKVSLDSLPSRFQGSADIFCQHGLVVSRTTPLAALHHACVINPTNLTSRTLPYLCDNSHRPVSDICLEGNGGDFTFRAYANGNKRQRLGLPSYDGTVYHSSAHAWEKVQMSIQPWLRDDRRPVVGLIKDATYFIHDDSKGRIHVILYSCKSGDLVHSFPLWEQSDQVVLVKVAVRDEEFVALAFSTSEENVCEVWQVGIRDTRWVRVHAVPHGELPCCDPLFFTVRDVEVVDNIAFITVMRYALPVHTTWEAHKNFWLLDRTRIERYCYSRLGSRFHTEHGSLVACDLAKGSWRIACDRWPFPSRRKLIQLNPAIDVSRRGEDSAPEAAGANPEEFNDDSQRMCAGRVSPATVVDTNKTPLCATCIYTSTGDLRSTGSGGARMSTDVMLLASQTRFF